MSRRLLADHSGISERYISQLEAGKGNVSIVLLRHVAAALGVPLGRLVSGDSTSAEMTLLGEFLGRLTREQQREAYAALSAWFTAEAGAARDRRVALIGLRGAGKTTLGNRLADMTGLPFFELDREVERISGTPLASIIELYGQPAYRRYELQALTELLERETRFIVATGGSIVSEASTYELLLRHCFTVWIATSPEEHMSRVIAQGDRRPMAGSAQAMQDLQRILAERTPLYSRADVRLDTAGRSEKESMEQLLEVLPAPLRTTIAAQ